MATVTGKYFLKPFASGATLPSASSVLTESLNYTIYAYPFSGATVTGSVACSQMRLQTDGSMNFYRTSTGTWHNLRNILGSVYHFERIIDFGTGNQTVTDNFYNYFIQSAIALTGENTLQGRYRLKSNLSLTNGVYFEYESGKYLVIGMTRGESVTQYLTSTAYTFIGGTLTALSSGDIIEITEPITISDYELQVFNSAFEKALTLTYDLTKLNLNDGTHTITVRANAEGYKSAVSNTVSYVLQHLTIDASVSGNILTISGMQSGVNKTITLYGEPESDVLATITNVTASSTTYDLSTLGLAAGEHTISVQASADGYKDSAIVTVFYTVAASGYKVTISSSFTQLADTAYALLTYGDGTTNSLTIISNKGRSYDNVVKVMFSASGLGGGKVYYTMGGVNGSEYPWVNITLTGDMVIKSSDMECLTGDTLVTMADYSTKRIDEIALGDYILSYDWETMMLVPNKVIYTDAFEHKSHTEYDLWSFSDGSFVKTVHRHRFFNVERKAFVYMDEWKIGEHTVNIKGEKVALVSHETIKENVNHYKITGELGTNYFANGLLTGDRYCPTDIEL